MSVISLRYVSSTMCTQKYYNLFRQRHVPRAQSQLYPANFQNFIVTVVKSWYSMDAKREPDIVAAMRTWAYVEHGDSNAAKAQKTKVSMMAFIVL